jgi:hypothetical protein
MESMMTTPEHTRKHHLRIPFKLQVVFGSRKFFAVFTIVMAAVSLFGPITGRTAVHNGYRYLLGPFVCPLIGLAMHLLFPLNPYRWNSIDSRSLNRLDERDEDARRLVEILQAPGYRRATLMAALRLVAQLFAILACCAVVLRASLNWRVVSSGFFFGWVGGVLFAWMFIRVQVVSWALTTWWQKYGEPPDHAPSQ